MSAPPFTAGQRVTLLSGSIGQHDDFSIVTVDRVTHGGKWVHVGANVYDQHGRHKEGSGARRSRIEPTTRRLSCNGGAS